MTDRGIVLTAIFDSARKQKDGGWKLTFEVDRSFAEPVMQITNLDTGILRVVVFPEEVLGDGIP